MRHTNDSFDNLIIYCEKHKLLTVPVKSIKKIGSTYNNNVVKIGNIVLDCHRHDTGNSVYGYIVTDDDYFWFMSITFWHYERYEFNEDMHVKGAWDSAFDNAIELMKKAVEEHKEKEREINLIARKEREEQERIRLNKFEQLF